MKFLFELLPVIVFFIVFYLAKVNFFNDTLAFVDSEWIDSLNLADNDFFIALAALIICMTVQMAWLLWRKKPLSFMQKGSYLLVLVLGGITFALQNKMFFKLKPTAFFWLIAVVFLVMSLIFKKEPLKLFFDKSAPEEKIQLPNRIWRHLTFSWVIFCALLGGLNAYIAYNFSDEVWTNFKLFGLMGLFILFGLGQAIYISRHIEKPLQ